MSHAGTTLAPVLALRVREATPATSRAVLLRLDLEGRSFPYRAGQAALLGRHGQPTRRAYSIASAPGDAAASRSLEFLVARTDTGALGAHLAPLDPGTLVDVEGPLGSFTLPDAAESGRLVLVAGGTGIAPLRAMLHDALRHRPLLRLALALSARSARDVPFGAELDALVRQRRADVLVTLTREIPDGWHGAQGRLTCEHLAPLLGPGETWCAVCGPPGFVAHATTLLTWLGVEESRILGERW